jgi:hypothetical protein
VGVTGIICSLRLLLILDTHQLLDPVEQTVLRILLGGIADEFKFSASLFGFTKPILEQKLRGFVIANHEVCDLPFICLVAPICRNGDGSICLAIVLHLLLLYVPARPNVYGACPHKQNAGRVWMLPAFQVGCAALRLVCMGTSTAFSTATTKLTGLYPLTDLHQQPTLNDVGLNFAGIADHTTVSGFLRFLQSVVVESFHNHW